MIFNKVKSLKKKALDLRRETFNMFIKKGEAHLGGSFSLIEGFSGSQNFLCFFEILYAE